MRENSCGEARSVARGSGWPPSARSVYRRAYRPIHRRRGRVSWRGRVAGRLPLDLGENPNGFGSVPWSRKLSFRPKGDAPRPAVLAGVANQEATACHHGSRNVSHGVHGGGQICRGVFPCRPGGLVYDHRNFGRSEGEPRQGINPWIQCRGYRDAVKLVERLNGVDPERIALWGGQAIPAARLSSSARLSLESRSSSHRFRYSVRSHRKSTRATQISTSSRA